MQYTHFYFIILIEHAVIHYVKFHLTPFVSRFYKTDPNRTSGKIKLTPPVDGYTIVLRTSFDPRDYSNYSRLVLTDVFLGGMESLKGGFRPCKLRTWLGKNQWLTGGKPNNVGLTFFLLILLHISH